MNRLFPRVNRKNFTSDSGVNLVSRVINDELGWIFRKNHNETDYGIDGFIDVATESGEVTGQSFAVQVKSGTSFFKHKTSSGFMYYGESKHLGYYRNQQLPLLLIICSPAENVCLFTKFDELAIEPSGNGWKININAEDAFGSDAKSKLLKMLPPLKEGIDELKAHWAFNDELVSASVIYYAVDRDDIRRGDIRNFARFLERLCVNERVCRKVQGKLEVMIDGYNHDKRELYEIKEVRGWFKKADTTNVAWFYFCNLERRAFGLHLYLACMGNAKVMGSPKRLSEPPRVLRRLHHLREWSHEQIQQVFP